MMNEVLLLTEFDVTRKIEKILEIWSLEIARKGIWQLSPFHNTSISTSLVCSIVNSRILIRTIKFTFLCPENYLHLPEIAREQLSGGGGAPPTYTPVATALYSYTKFKLIC